MTLEKINDSTPVRDFPGIYNGNIDELVSELSAKDNEINRLKNEINNLRSSFYSSLSELRAEYQALFDKKMEEFEGKFVKIEDNQ